MNRKGYLILLFSAIFGFVSINPDYTDGSTPDRMLFLPGNSRLTNSYSDNPDYAYLDRSIRYFMRKWELKGASVAIARSGKLVFAKGYGTADGVTDVEPFHQFRIASVSKLITATAIMKLYEEGRLNLNDHVFGGDGILNDDYYANPKDKRAFRITVAHLLSHQGGWTTRWGDHMFMPLVVASSLNIDSPVETRNVVRFALNKRLHFTPGKGRSYSNLGYAILGLVIEEVSGLSFEEYCKKELFEPIGIFDIELGKNLYTERSPYEVKYFEPSNAIPKKSVYGTGETVPAANGGNDIESLGGAGGWIATAPDLLRFVLAVDGLSSREDIISKESVYIMTNRTSGLAPVGWKGTTSNGYWWRTGSFAGTSAMVRRMPDGTLWVVLFNTNTWKQSKFPTDISYMMSRIVAGTKRWLDEDLFDYSLPVPLEPFPFLSNSD
ncbi:MAG: beta-lactamase family protein [Bacteroidales bacterium]|nr:beta-lactamase family protein [Bacteroidales bacterium]